MRTNEYWYTTIVQEVWLTQKRYILLGSCIEFSDMTFTASIDKLISWHHYFSGLAKYELMMTRQLCDKTGLTRTSGHMHIEDSRPEPSNFIFHGQVKSKKSEYRGMRTDLYRGTPVSGPAIIDWQLYNCDIGCILQVLSGNIGRLHERIGSDWAKVYMSAVRMIDVQTLCIRPNLCLHGRITTFS